MVLSASLFNSTLNHFVFISPLTQKLNLPSPIMLSQTFYQMLSLHPSVILLGQHLSVILFSCSLHFILPLSLPSFVLLTKMWT